MYWLSQAEVAEVLDELGAAEPVDSFTSKELRASPLGFTL
jgi:hypothetical protein